MFSFRLCRESDKDCWITLNRMFMEEEIQDHDLWNDTNKVSDEQFSNTFFEALQAKEFIRYASPAELVPLPITEASRIPVIEAHAPLMQ